MLDDENFVLDLIASTLVVEDFARRLNLHGIETEIPPTRVRPSFDERSLFNDGGTDLFAWTSSGARRRIQVKQRDLVFSGPRDYPYPTAFVAEVSTHFDAEPHARAILSKVGGCVVIPRQTRQAWAIVERFDRRYQLRKRYYVAPREALLGFDDLVAAIKRARSEVVP